VLTGGCPCGAVRHEAGSTLFHAVICHCTMCRRAAGAAAIRRVGETNVVKAVI
jgi:hypothetical protein